VWRRLTGCKSFHYLLTDPRQIDILQSSLAGTDGMQFDQLKRLELPSGSKVSELTYDR